MGSGKSKGAVYHEKELTRGWRLLHQLMQLEVDLNTCTLRGTATMSVRALNENCCVIGINLRRCHIIKCFVNDIESEFTYASALDDPLLLDAVFDTTQPHRMEDIKRELDELHAYGDDDGELRISILPREGANMLDDLLAAERCINGDGAKEAVLPFKKLPGAVFYFLPR